MADSSRLLIEEPPLQVLPTLAKLLGIEQAIILQQVHYWVKTSNHEIGGNFWIYNRYKDWVNQFPWLSERAIRHHVRLLEKAGLLITGDFNKDRRDHTKWYRIGYDALEELLVIPESSLTDASGHATNVAMPADDLCHMEATNLATSVPEITTETTPKDHSKKRYGEFENVRLTDDEHQKLAMRFGGGVDDRIERLSGYKKSKGKTYRDDYATILNWARRDNGQTDAPRGRSQGDITEDADALAAAWRHA